MRRYQRVGTGGLAGPAARPIKIRVKTRAGDEILHQPATRQPESRKTQIAAKVAQAGNATLEKRRSQNASAPATASPPAFARIAVRFCQITKPDNTKNRSTPTPSAGTARPKASGLSRP